MFGWRRCGAVSVSCPLLSSRSPGSSIALSLRALQANDARLAIGHQERLTRSIRSSLRVSTPKNLLKAGLQVLARRPTC